MIFTATNKMYELSGNSANLRGLNTEVFILDAMPTIASVKVIFNECIEYLHIAKLNDKWKIVNNLFTGNPDYKRND